MSSRRRANERQGEAASEIVADRFDGEHVPGESYWYDVVTPNGTKYEGKSTHTTTGDDFPSEGRFRLWEDQHTSLTSAEAAGTAWYAFVLFSKDDDLLGVQRRKPSTVTRIVRDLAVDALYEDPTEPDVDRTRGRSGGGPPTPQHCSPRRPTTSAGPTCRSTTFGALGRASSRTPTSTSRSRSCGAGGTISRRF